MNTLGGMKDMKKILFCTPSHDGRVAVDYLRGCLDVNRQLHNQAFVVDYFWQEHGSDIVKGREDMLWSWYHETDHEYMLFMDSDQGFTAETIKQLFDTAEKQVDPCVVAAPVPLKEFKEQRVVDYIVGALHEENSPFSLEGMLPSTWDYNFLGDHLVKEAQTNIVQVERVGTGCMLIKRNVIDKIIARHLEGEETGCTTYKSKVSDQDAYSMFTHLFMGEKILGEDYSFCIRMLLNEIPVLVDLRCDVTHHGSFAYKGNFQEKKEFLKHLRKLSDKTT